MCQQSGTLGKYAANGRLGVKLWKILKRNKPQLLRLSEPSVLIIDVNIHFDTFSATDGNLTTCLTHERVMMLR